MSHLLIMRLIVQLVWPWHLFALVRFVRSRGHAVAVMWSCGRGHVVGRSGGLARGRRRVLGLGGVSRYLGQDP